MEDLPFEEGSLEHKYYQLSHKIEDLEEAQARTQKRVEAISRNLSALIESVGQLVEITKRG